MDKPDNINNNEASCTHYEIALAGYLHDIGKFYERVYNTVTTGNEYEGVSKDIIAKVNELHHGKAFVSHVYYTCAAIEKMTFPETICKEKVLSLAVNHHNFNTTSEERKVNNADTIATTIDRGKKGGTSTIQRKLMSIAATVNDKIDDIQTSYYNLKECSVNVADFFPHSDGQCFADSKKVYSELWEKFLQDWNSIKSLSASDFLHKADSVLQRYTAAIPSATNTVYTDIPLYDHGKVTATLSVASLLFDSSSTCYLFACDVNGIQKYIYDIATGSGSPAKRLRARSFEISLYSEVISQVLLHRLQLPISQRIIISGGKFVLLLPNNKGMITAIDKMIDEAKRWIFKKTDGEAFITTSSHKCGKKEIKSFAEVNRKLDHGLVLNKNQAYASVIQSGSEWDIGAFLGDINTDISDDNICESCRRDLVSAENSGDDENKLCKQCKKDKEIGETVLESRYAVLYSDNSGKYKYPLGSVSLRKTLPQPKNSDNLITIIDMDGFAGAKGISEHTTRRYYSRHVAKSGVQVTDFSALAEMSSGRKALGVLKMDIDELGWIFACGATMPEDKKNSKYKRSISRVATLSRQVEYFMSGYINAVLKEEEYKDCTYLIYAGGDDLVVVGAWNKMFDLAMRLNNDLKKFAGNNIHWHFSAGLEVANSNKPILGLVEKADKKLEVSKQCLGKDVVMLYQNEKLLEPAYVEPESHCHKNRITAFETCIPFDELPEVLEAAKQLHEWVENSKSENIEDLKDSVTIGQLRRLYNLAKMYRDYKRTKNTSYVRYDPLLTREVRRNWKGVPAEWAKKYAGDIESIKLQSLCFICKYVINSTRDQENKET